MDQEQPTTQPEQPAQPEIQQPDVPAEPTSPIHKETPGQLNIILWVVGALLLIFLVIGGFYIFQQVSIKPSPTPAPLTKPPIQPTPTPTPEELAVPTVSEDTSLGTVEKELNATDVLSPEGDLQQLDQEASQL